MIFISISIFLLILIACQLSEVPWAKAQLCCFVSPVQLSNYLEFEDNYIATQEFYLFEKVVLF